MIPFPHIEPEEPEDEVVEKIQNPFIGLKGSLWGFVPIIGVQLLKVRIQHSVNEQELLLMQGVPVEPELEEELLLEEHKFISGGQREEVPLQYSVGSQGAVVGRHIKADV